MLEVIDRGENTRTIRIGRREIKLNREDPHGFWFFHWNDGCVPDALDQAYTGSSTAMEHLENWWARQPANMDVDLEKTRKGKPRQVVLDSEVSE